MFLQEFPRTGITMIFIERGKVLSKTKEKVKKVSPNAQK